MEEEIRKSLNAIVNSQKESGLDLVTALRNLDNLVSRSGDDLNPRLRHFLQNRSYEKALLWLDGESPEAGICQK